MEEELSPEQRLELAYKSIFDYNASWWRSRTGRTKRAWRLFCPETEAEFKSIDDRKNLKAHGVTCIVCYLEANGDLPPTLPRPPPDDDDFEVQAAEFNQSLEEVIEDVQLRQQARGEDSSSLLVSMMVACSACLPTYYLPAC